MKKRRMSKIGLRISLAIFVVELFVFIMLFSFISNGTSSTTEESAENNMKIVARDRSEIIKNYVQTAESSLSGYLKAGPCLLRLCLRHVQMEPRLYSSHTVWHCQTSQSYVSLLSC